MQGKRALLRNQAQEDPATQVETSCSGFKLKDKVLQQTSPPGRWSIAQGALRMGCIIILIRIMREEEENIRNPKQ